MEDRHWWFRSRRRVIWALINRAQPQASPRILDAGCGTGRNLMDFRTLGPAEGVDVSPQAVEFCQRRGLDGVRNLVHHKRGAVLVDQRLALSQRAACLVWGRTWGSANSPDSWSSRVSASRLTLASFRHDRSPRRQP